MNLPSWVEDYRGRPFRRGADGPATFDCYGLVRAVLRDRWGIATPELEGIHLHGSRGRLEAATEGEGAFWTEVDEPPRPGDVLAFVGPTTQGELHVGIVIADGWMLHAREGSGVETARYGRPPWALMRLGGVFRPKQAPTFAP